MLKYLVILLFCLTSCSYSTKRLNWDDAPVISIEMDVTTQFPPIMIIEPEMSPWETDFAEFTDEVIEYIELWITRLDLGMWNINYGYADLGDDYLGMTWMWLDADGLHATLRLTLPTTATSEMFSFDGGEWQEVIIHELLHIKEYEVLWTASNNPAMLAVIEERFVNHMGLLLRELEHCAD